MYLYIVQCELESQFLKAIECYFRKMTVLKELVLFLSIGYGSTT